ncbi:hypothetical protein EDB84DRAFT_1441443 [Lactarius hengduanensis]|nr:hypothetical protein EDB84DRAFT_1441443 [Lactarius hengduanensis]
MCAIALGLGLIDASETGCAFSFFVGQLLRLRLLDGHTLCGDTHDTHRQFFFPCLASRMIARDLSGVLGGPDYIGSLRIAEAQSFPAASHTVTKGKRIRDQGWNEKAPRHKESELEKDIYGSHLRLEKSVGSSAVERWSVVERKRRLLSWKRRWGGRDNNREDANMGKCVSTEGD